MNISLEHIERFPPKTIEGIPCYSPATAFENEDYPSSAYGQYSDLEERHFWFKARARVLVFLISKFAQQDPEDFFLEIGCGTGYVAQQIAQECSFQVVASDVHISGLRIAKARESRVAFVQVNAKALPFHSAFTAVGAFDVLEHIDDDHSIIEGIHELIKPNGLFFLSVPQYQWMWSKLDDVGEHKRRYTRKDLESKLEHAGFKVEYISSFMFTLFPLMIISRFLKKNGRTPDSEYGELRLNPILNRLLYTLTSLDVLLMKRGLSLPWGGSLIAIARKHGV